ncbi:MAG: dephospho-CoA kinase [Chloroflexota bacterium]
MTFLLGLTGNIACGKSTVGKILSERYGAEYIDADRVVHSLYAAGTPETAAVAARFGPDLLGDDGTIDRRRLGDIVMADAAALRDLEALLGPGIRRALEARLAGAKAPVVALDAIRLIEAGLAACCQTVWVVTCDRDAQVARLQTSRGLSREQAALRVDAQAPVADKLEHADAVIANAASVEALESQIAQAWQRTVAPHLTQPDATRD